MRYFFHKYSSKFILSVLSFTIILSCIQKHKFESDKKELDEKKMSAVLTDIFQMEAYVKKKVQNINSDSTTLIKKSLYAPILKHHKVDSAEFYSTFNYYQSHPKEFIVLLNVIDSNMNKIKALDTTFVKPAEITTPKNIDKINDFNEQEKAM